jgi:hypothetical protein
MRLWSLHPKYLDAKGLVALWRETLLAQNVLLGNTKGYKFHPQLTRFKQHPCPPIDSIGKYLSGIYEESTQRNYNFNKDKIISFDKKVDQIAVATGQVVFEINHLNSKLSVRDPVKHKEIKNVIQPELHPLFYSVEGSIEDWERI